MRIGIVAPPWVSVPPVGYGGTESVIDRLAQGFVGAGHEVLLWTTGDSTCPVPKGWVLDHADRNRMGAAVVELHHLIHGYEALVAWGADVVHDHTLIGPVHARRHAGLPVVTTNHGPFNDELTTLYRAVTEEVALIAISADQAARGIRAGLAIDAVIHHGIDLDLYRPGPGTGDERGKYHLYLGRMAPEKGARRAALAAREAGVRLLLAAKMIEAAEREFFAEQVEPLLDDRIQYVGEIDIEEKLQLLRGARSLVNPIRWAEPFGLVMIEALACGTPVLATREGAAPEIVDHGVTGFLCDDVADTARRLLDVTQIDRRACREVAERRFGIRRMVDEHLVLFEQVVQKRTPWPRAVTT
ncbi:MAG: glycosyltransferase family 4 protein [Acidimicrobiia bacterium]